MTVQAEQQPVRPRRILVAEDIDINRDILASVLADEGHDLVFAANGAEAVQLVQRTSFDLVLMDVEMPVMDGVQATLLIRKLEGEERNIPILALSANLNAEDRERYLSSGMNDCLAKPFDWAQIAAAIDRYGTGDHPPGAPAAAVLTPQHDARLVNIDVLARLQTTVGPDQLRMIIRMGIDAYGLYCDAMLDPAAGSDDIGREAHKLKGSAGTLGLGRVGAVAAQIEIALDDGLPVDALVRELKQAIEATRIELARIGAV